MSTRTRSAHARRAPAPTNPPNTENPSRDTNAKQQNQHSLAVYKIAKCRYSETPLPLLLFYSDPRSIHFSYIPSAFYLQNNPRKYCQHTSKIVSTTCYVISCFLCHLGCSNAFQMCFQIGPKSVSIHDSFFGSLPSAAGTAKTKDVGSPLVQSLIFNCKLSSSRRFCDSKLSQLKPIMVPTTIKHGMQKASASASQNEYLEPKNILATSVSKLFQKSVGTVSATMSQT
jgi:hypothetical protein